MGIHAQSFFPPPASHFPFDCPPHGPFRRLLAHLVIGQMPAVSWSMHSPHARQYSWNWLFWVSCLPMNLVSFAGMISLSE